MLTVVIPTLNEAKRLPRCLESLSNQTLKDFEVFVVDSVSKDGTADIARKWGAKVLCEPMLGVSIAKNTGASKVKSDVLVFTDADTTSPPDWLEKISKHFEDEKVVCVFGAIRPNDGNALDRFVFYVSSDLFPKIAHVFGFMIAHGPNIAFRRKVFVESGGYDERLTILEDNELPNRVRNYGKVVFDSSIWVYASARRFQEEGHLRPFLRFMKGYWDLYVRKIHAKVEYPPIR